MGILYIRNENDEFVAIPALKGDKGEDGFSPIITENINNTDEIYQLDIETADGKFTTPNLKGNGVEAPTEEYKYSVKVIGTIGAGYYSTGISLDQIINVYETGSPVSDLYGGWTIDSVESDDTSIADFANFSNYTDTNIISENVTVYNLFELSSSEAAGTTYSITYQWNGYQKKATTTYTSIEELENIKGITIDRDTEDMCASILANLKPNEELVLNSVDNIGFGINSTVYGDTIKKIVFYIGEKGSVIAYLKNGVIATRSYEENYLQSWDFSLTNIDTYITYHSIEDLEARKNETLFFVNEEPDTKIQVIFEALDFGEKFFSGKATSAEEWGIETSGNPALPIFQIIKYHDSTSERGCVYAIDSLGNIYIRNIYRGILDANWTVNYKTEINDFVIDEYTTWSSSKIDQSIKKTYYNLSQMNLTEDATIDDIMNALDYGEEAVIQISDFSDKEQFLNEHGCFFCRKCGPGADDVDLWINNFTGNVYCGQASSNSFFRWKPIPSNFTIYESAWDFGGHPAHSIIENNKKMTNRSMLTYVPDSYADQEQYLNLTSPLVTIIKLDESHYNMTMIDNETEAFYYGILDENNDFNKWVKVGASDGTKIDDSVTGADTTWSSEKIANDYSTKEYVAEQVANASHLKREIVTAIPEADAAQENTIYMLKVESVLGDDKYQEWQLINGEMVLIGDTSIDLSGYAKTYTTLDELGLTADATVEDVVSALKNGESFLAPVNIFTNYATIFPNKVPNDQWNKIHIVKGTSLASSHIRCFSPSGTSEYLANINNTSIVGWIDVSGAYIDISDTVIEKLGMEILKYPVGKYRINSTTIGSKFTDLPSEAQMKCGLIEINGTAVGKSPFADSWVYRMYKFECLVGSANYTRRLNSGATAGQIEVDTGWRKVGQEIFTTLEELGLTTDATIDDVRGALQVGESCIIRTDAFTDLTQFNGIQWGYLKITVGVNKMSEIWLNDVTSPYGLYYGRQASGKFDKWINISTQRTYTELVQLGLTADATVDDVLSKLQPGEVFTSGVTQFTNYQTLFPYDTSNDQYSRVFIQQGTSLATAYIKWFRKDGSREALANLDSSNKLRGWNEHTMNEIIHTSLTESLAGITTTLDLINALITEYRAKNKPVRFISGSVTKTTLTDLPSNYGLLDITVAGYDLVEARFSQSEFGFKKMYYGYLNRASSETLFSSLSWKEVNTSTTTLVTNTSTLKLDVTKKNASWYGAVKLIYLYGTSPVEVDIDFRSATDPLTWTVVNGQKYIKAITYTQDADNKAHYTIGVEFSGTTYGCYQAEVIGSFADINSLTEDAFTGETTAVYGNPWGKNNGVTLVSAPEDLGLTSPCTTVQLVQAMRNTFNKTITSGAVGVFNNGGSTITDAPSDYGLLHIEVFGHDRVMIRYDGIGGSTYNGSWIGKIKGNNGTFSEVTWSKIAFEGESSGDVAWTTATVNSGIGYATNSAGGYTTKYAIKNNVVYINSNIKCNTVKDGGYDTLITGLPAPSTYLFFTLQPDAYGNTPIIAQVDENGNLKLRSGTAGKTYMLSISYPII